MKNLTWFESGDALREIDIQEAQSLLGVKFPPDYEFVVLNHDGASNPDECEFEYLDRGKKRIGNFGTLLSVRKEQAGGVFEVIENLAGQLPERLVPVVDTGSGDCICLDYRGSSVPVISYFAHEFVGEDAVLFLAGTFGEFLDKLQTPSDE